jgi:phosphoenolpyruvate-protein kinase (PTS system EI component)
VLRLIDQTARAAKRAGIPVSVCGEMAARPLYAPLLLGLGIEELSMDPVSIPAVKETIRAISAREARQIASEALRLSSAGEIRRLLLKRFGPLVNALRDTAKRPRGG